jgi:hypothetical protein
MATACYKTKVRNISGADRVFGWVPPHGKKLEAGEEYEIYGDLSAHLAGNKRQSDGFQRDVDNGRIAVVSTPIDHHYDTVHAETKLLGIHDHAVRMDDPCGGAYSSSV